jgi:hypothetical protein
MNQYILTTIHYGNVELVVNSYAKGSGR